jgi:hypothetical protein
VTDSTPAFDVDGKITHNTTDKQLAALLEKAQEGNLIHHGEGLQGFEIALKAREHGVVVAGINCGKTEGYLAVVVEKKYDLPENAYLKVFDFPTYREARGFRKGVEFVLDSSITLLDTLHFRNGNWAVSLLDQDS